MSFPQSWSWISFRTDVIKMHAVKNSDLHHLCYSDERQISRRRGTWVHLLWTQVKGLNAHNILY